MPPEGGTRRNGPARPAGIARGVTSLGMAWLIAAAIALLTGAAAVIMMMAVGLVAFLAALVSGRRVVARSNVVAVTTAELAEEGDALSWQLRTTGTQRVHAELKVADTVVAAGWAEPGSTVLSGTAPSRGIHRAVVAEWSSAGRLGLVWWRKRTTVAIAALAVAPRPSDQAAPLTRLHSDRPEQLRASAAPGRDEVDGVRTWREGDEVSAVHWPATLRAGEFVMRQRRRDIDERWLVQAVTGTGDSRSEAARVRTAAEQGLAAGARVAVQVNGSGHTDLADRRAVLHWTAAFEPERATRNGLRWWHRQVGEGSAEPDSSLTPRARWLVAAAALPPLVMLLQPLGYGLLELAVVVAGVAAGAFVSLHSTDSRRTFRQLLGLMVGLLVAVSLIDFGAIDSVVTSLRYLLPQVLVTLVIMQGFECNDRRSARVSLACSAMLTAYASGIRVDGTLAGWLGVALLGLAVATQAVTSADRQSSAVAVPTASIGRLTTLRQAVRPSLSLVGGALAVLALLAAVPIPEGPAQLTLPSWLDEYRGTPDDGSLVAADGSPLLGGSVSRDRTGADGTGVGGYPGFSPTMDISLRGDLGDAVVLRVRSPYSDFWRGQTFTEFDGRSWHVDERTGVRTEGPDHAISPTNGDVPSTSDDTLIQTFYAEVDLPNIVFGATRVERVLLEAPLFARPDGALRATVVLPAGSAYTVVSRRTDATAAGLRADGDISLIQSPPQFVELPASFSARTRTLALELAAGTDNTYDVIRAIQAWLADNVGYDLDAPVPPAGADAVDHFLFESQLGFCEQIATATAMLLRSLGIPARVATGYVPSERDEVAGVWVSRANDAHAWVEVRFPSFGWVAFDPTATVPLAGDAERSTIGGDLARAIAEAVADHLVLLLLGAVTLAVLAIALRAGHTWWQRRRRGRWGVLQDRFLAAALQQGASVTASNAELAAVFDQPAANGLAELLDRSAFAAEWDDSDAAYEVAFAALQRLEHSR